eukprot:9317524-Ditylum_brightwellii.AAC.1
MAEKILQLMSLKKARAMETMLQRIQRKSTSPSTRTWRRTRGITLLVAQSKGNSLQSQVLSKLMPKWQK